MERRKKGGILKYILIAVIAIIIISALTTNDDDNSGGTDLAEQTETTTETQMTETTEDIADIEETIEETAEETIEETTPVAEPYQAELTAGHYTAGIDFPSGRYDLIAKSGTGNVSSSNMFSGGLNEVMSNPKDDFSIDVFNNAKLDDSVTLTIGGTLNLEINSEEANVADVQPRENSLTETVELSSGNYVAGDDFPAGVYDIIAKEGSGNVSSSNIFEGGLNEVMGSAADDFSIKKYKNASLDEGVELSISGVTIQLIPSK